MKGRTRVSLGFLVEKKRGPGDPWSVPVEERLGKRDTVCEINKLSPTSFSLLLLPSTILRQCRTLVDTTNLSGYLFCYGFSLPPEIPYPGPSF